MNKKDHAKFNKAAVKNSYKHREAFNNERFHLKTSKFIHKAPKGIRKLHPMMSTYIDFSKKFWA